MDAEGSCEPCLRTGGDTGHAWGSEQRQEESAGRSRWLQSWLLRRHLSPNVAFPWGEYPCSFSLPLALGILWGVLSAWTPSLWPAWPAFPGFHVDTLLWWLGTPEGGQLLLRPCHSDPITTKHGTPPPWHTCPHAFGEHPSEGSCSYTELGGEGGTALTCWLWSKDPRSEDAKRNQKRGYGCLSQSQSQSWSQGWASGGPPTAGKEERASCVEGGPALHGRWELEACMTLPFLSFFSSSSPPAPSKVKMMPVWEFTPTAVTTILPEPSMT